MALATDRAPLSGALWALSATVGFTAVDVIVKFLSAGYPHYQLTFLRTVVAMVVLLVIIVPLTGGRIQFRTTRRKQHFLRGICVVFANLCFFLALAAMPLAEAVAIFFVSPFLIALFSIFFLGETVGPRRWAAIGVGLIGVLIVLRPGSETFQIAALLPIGAAIGYGMLHIYTRRMGDTENAVTLTFFTQLVMMAVGAVAGLALGFGQFDVFEHPSLSFLFRAWVWPNALDAGLILALGLSIAVSGFAISEAYRRSEPAFIAPFEYIALPLSVLWGILVFDEWPDFWAFVGIFLILASGMVLIWREAVARRSGDVDRAARM
ncbi:MAG: DMT family transporter [Pseudomonadota bacterium]